MKNYLSFIKSKEIFLSSLSLLFILSFFLSFFVALKVVLMGVLILYILFYNSFSDKLSLFKQRPYTWFALAFSIILLVSTFYSDNVQMGLRFLQLRLPLILFPITLGLIAITRYRRDHILLGIAVITTVCCAASLVYSIYRAVSEQDTAWLYNDALSWLIGQQSIYTSLLVNVSVYVVIYFLFYKHPGKKQKVLLVATLLFLLITSYLLASRNMMAILYLSLICFFLFYTIKRKKYVQGIAMLLLLVAGATITYWLFPSTINRFRELSYTDFEYSNQGSESHYAGKLTPDQWNGANFRLAAWQCGWQLFKEHPFTGTGLGDKQDELYAVYAQRNFQYAIDTGKNVHNNYLDILYSLGVAALFVFLTGWIGLPLITLWRHRDWLAIAILATLVAATMTEVYFDRSLGAILFAFLIPLLLTPYSGSKYRTRN